MRHLLVSVFLVACSGADVGESAATSTTPAPASDDHGAAVAFAKACVEKNDYKPVWKTTIATDRITATHIEERQWVVDFPETGTDEDGHVVTLGLPMGMMIRVDLDAKTCRRMMLE